MRIRAKTLKRCLLGDSNKVSLRESIKKEDDEYYSIDRDSVKTPKDVKKAITDRIKELHEAIALEDEKGYNDHGIKQNAVDALSQILQNLETGNVQGVKEAQIFLGTLMSPILNLLPQQLFNWLGTALNVVQKTGAKVEESYTRID